MNERTATVVIYVVGGVWVVNIFAGMFRLHGYEPSEAINGIFMGIVGYAFIERSRRRDPRDRDDDQ